ncbi:methyl-accepting chemotaxis protein [Xylophilus sp. GOD-11R]|uniref:methyl-accepting chemotaxis protein n=1 Tax=Xylophilus sp. GOD-11R TaxID=3089814 RepID=UPI00298BED9A|nr:methyl-accepting chemotaxis protein [Xylophilus sp. GOD-11R]WPB57010.1 methyl-accepting chemotaxis protein [Xylophilus sp. GOD-11R]
MSVFSLRRFTIRMRMFGAIVLVVALVALLGGGGFWGMGDIQRKAENFVSTSSAATGQMTELRDALQTARRAEKDMIIQYEKPEGVRAARAVWAGALDKAAATGKRFADEHGDDDARAMNDVLERIGRYRQAFSATANQLENNGYESATTANRMSARAVAVFEEAEKNLAVLDAGLRTRTEEQLAAQRRTSGRIQMLFAIVVLVAVLTVVPLTLMNMRSICLPLEQARRTAQAIAQGDLSQPIAVEGRDELADLQRALAGMQDGLGAMVAQVRNASESIASASQQIAAGNQDLSNRTENTAGNVQQTVASITELGSNVQQTASSAQTAHALATTASGAATRGGAVVQQAVASMQDIAASSRRINDIIALIDSIAFQTNILALNAAVEAARAGEQGRGFAVVASEVRNLAQRSAQAAQEIKGLIETSVNAVDGGVKLVRDAGVAMEEIVAGVKRVGGIIGEISAAANQQTTGIGEVSDAVQDIDRMTQQNAALVEESAAAAESLREQAQRLAGVVGQFRLAQVLGHAMAMPGRDEPQRLPGAAPRLLAEA